MTSNNNPYGRDQIENRIRLRRILQGNGSLRIDLPTGQTATITERIVPEQEDTSPLELTVREALQKAFSLYYSTEDEGTQIYKALAENETVEITEDIKAQANSCIQTFATDLFNKKMLDAESLSDWENALAKLVAVPDRKMQKRWIALCTSLPRFYNLNITKKKLAELKESVPDNFAIDFDTVDKNGKPIVAKLRFLEKLVERNSKRSQTTYIFTQNCGPEVSSIIEYPVDSKDVDKISMLDFIVRNELIECQLHGRSNCFIGTFRSLRIKNIKFL